MKRLFATLSLLLLLLGTAQAQPNCNAQFSYTPAPQGNNLLRVQFQNNSPFGYYQGQYYANYWLFYGDNTSQSNAFSTHYHNYASTGTYTVILAQEITDSISNAWICTDGDTQTVTVSYPACGTSWTYTASTTTQGQLTFTATTPAGTSGMSYAWSFGDGSSGTGASVTHTYASSGTYTVTLVASAGSPASCSYTNTQTVIVPSLGANCAGHNASFSYTNQGNSTYGFTNLSPSFAGQTRSANWYFGDGTGGFGNYLQHTYTSPGAYTVTLINHWYDSSNTSILLCSDTMSMNLNVTPPANVISGIIITDSFNNVPVNMDTFRVWLIQYNSSTNMLTAVDSVDVQGWGMGYYAFSGKPAGSYLTKAHQLDGPGSGPGLIPTYHDSSLYWNSAATISHTGGSSINKHIWMRSGAVTSGPGFIAGNVTLGANKGTGPEPVEGLAILLRDAYNQPVRLDWTDENGDFSFQNLGLGTYSLYPEAMNYTTTPILNIELTTAQPSATGFRFGQTADEIKPKNTGISHTAATATAFRIYPNPATEMVTVSWKHTSSQIAQLSIRDMAGRILHSQNLDTGNGQGEAQLRISHLPAGYYLIQIRDAAGARSLPLIIQP